MPTQLGTPGEMAAGTLMMTSVRGDFNNVAGGLEVIKPDVSGTITTTSLLNITGSTTEASLTVQTAGVYLVLGMGTILPTANYEEGFAVGIYRTRSGTSALQSQAITQEGITENTGFTIPFSVAAIVPAVVDDKLSLFIANSTTDEQEATVTGNLVAVRIA